MGNYAIVTTEAGYCKCGDFHNKSDILWSGSIAEQTIEKGKEIVIEKQHDINTTVRNIE